MDVMRVEQRAKALLRSNFKCAEGVLKAVAEEAGLDSPLIPRVASGFCSGMARSGEMCGAVTGGIMALGLVCGRDSPDQSVADIYSKVQQFHAAFRAKFGSLNCLELTGCDLATDAGRRAFAEQGLAEKCTQFTALAAGLVAGLAGEQAA